MWRLFAALILGSLGCDQLFGMTAVDPNQDASGDTAGHLDARTDPLIDGAADSSIDATATAICPGDYNSFGGASLYKPVPIAKTWLAAQISCLQDQPADSTKHTHLVVIGSDPERGFVNAMVSGNGRIVWIGLTDRVMQTSFKWVTNQPTAGYPPATGGPWAANQPSNGTGEDCVEMNGTGDFDDVACGTLLPYVCECDDYPDVPANY